MHKVNLDLGLIDRTYNRHTIIKHGRIYGMDLVILIKVFCVHWILLRSGEFFYG